MKDMMDVIGNIMEYETKNNGRGTATIKNLTFNQNTEKMELIGVTNSGLEVNVRINEVVKISRGSRSYHSRSVSHSY